MSNDNGFYLKTGELTTYALACGYIEKAEVNGVQVTLWKEHGAYHVRAHDFNKHVRVSWDVFESVGPARRAYKAAQKAAKVAQF